jgi:uncharacterized membrane protein
MPGGPKYPPPPLATYVCKKGLATGGLSKAGIGCFIGNFFVGALAYADDLVLLAPTACAMRLMLIECDKYASEYEVVFNAKKSKCLIISS